MRRGRRQTHPETDNAPTKPGRVVSIDPRLTRACAFSGSAAKAVPATWRQLEAKPAASRHDHDNVIATPEELSTDLALQARLRVADCEPSVLHLEGRDEITLAVHADNLSGDRACTLGSESQRGDVDLGHAILWSRYGHSRRAQEPIDVLWSRDF